MVAAGFPGTSRFQIVRHLGSGGMGSVYEALDLARGTRVALKTVPVTSPDALLHLKNEFRALQDVRHRNLVDLVELVEHEGQWLFTMELVEGTDLLEHVRPGARARGASGVAATAPLSRFALDPDPDGPVEGAGGVLDEGRLREALLQLASGLSALHEAGKVHRDVKPSNVLVAADGRVVLVDFGLATTARGLRSGDGRAVGTRAFMAPEQAAGSASSAAADWYSVGVVLYQALTGELPFQGADIARKRAHGEAEPVRALNREAPADLADLAEALLALDPAARPGGNEVLRRLGAGEELDGPVSFVRMQAMDAFVGRSAELESLRAAFTDSRRRAVTVLITGDSGVGKSALVQELGRRVEGPGVRVLSGRCYERELVPYKAFDGIVDALSQHLRAMDPAEVARILPEGAGILSRVFPVLRRVPALAPEDAAADDPQTQRGRAFAAMRALLGRLAEEGPLVLCIDDLQWADTDSLQLLEDLVRPPEAPRLLLLATVRPRPSDGPDPVASALARAGDVRRVGIAPLPFEDARRLAADSLGPRGAHEAEAVAREAAGHPLFVIALALHAGGARGALKLDDALWTGIEGLPRPARDLLEILAVVGAPVQARTAGAAAALDPAACAASTRLLTVAHLARASAPATVEPYHDRVRETVLARLEPARRRDCHRRIAEALACTGDGDPRTLVHHLEGAGDHDGAAHQAERAAVQAAQALAFDQAVELYRTALRLGDFSARPREGQALRVALADALTNAGRGAEAADAYLACVESAAPTERIDHRRRAADHLLRSGHLERGRTILADVLREIGEAPPPTQAGALVSMLARRARTKLRGLRWDRREERDIAPAVLLRLDVYHAVSVSLALIDTVRGGVFQARAVALALEAGEPLRLGRSLAMDACYLGSTTSRGLARARAVLAELEHIARDSGDPYLGASATMVDGFLDYHGGSFATAVPKFRRAEARFREETRGTYFESGFCHWFRLVALRNRGMFGELSRGFFEWTRDAERRGDRFSEAALRLNLNAVWLARDAPEEARRDLDRAGWIPPDGGYHLQHWYEQYARCEIDLYTGDASAGLARMRPTMAAMSRAFLLRMRVHRVLARWTTGRLAVSAGGPRGLEEAEAIARQLRAEDVGYAQVFGALLGSAASRRRGREGDAADSLLAALALARHHDLPHLAEAARWRLGELAGDRGRELVAAARSWMVEQEIRAPEKMLRLWAP